MIASRHWMIAVIAAAFLHVVLASLLLAKTDDRAPVMLSAGGLEVGLGDGSANLDADTVDSLPAEVPVAEVKQVVVKKSAEPVKQPVPQPVQEPIETPVAQPVEPVKIETYEQPAAENAIAVQSAATENPQPEISSQETSGADNTVDVAQTVAATSGKKTSSGKSLSWGKSKGNGRLLRSYFGDIAALIDAHKDYPGEVKKEKQEGTVIVAFSINRKGELLSSVIQKSSGYALLDKAALATLARSSPFPPIPKAIDRDTLKIAVPIDYTLIKN